MTHKLNLKNKNNVSALKFEWVGFGGILKISVIEQILLIGICRYSDLETYLSVLIFLGSYLQTSNINWVQLIQYVVFLTDP